MTGKQFIIIFLILFFLPGLLGKVSLQPFVDFFNHISFETFTNAFTKVFQDDIFYYKNLVIPWVNQLIDFIKKNIPSTNLKVP